LKKNNPVKTFGYVFYFFYIVVSLHWIIFAKIVGPSEYQNERACIFN
jgi:hypothetical protein